MSSYITDAQIPSGFAHAHVTRWTIPIETLQSEKTKGASLALAANTVLSDMAASGKLKEGRFFIRLHSKDSPLKIKDAFADKKAWKVLEGCDDNVTEHVNRGLQWFTEQLKGAFENDDAFEITVGEEDPSLAVKETAQLHYIWFFSWVIGDTKSGKYHNQVASDIQKTWSGKLLDNVDACAVWRKVFPARILALFKTSQHGVIMNSEPFIHGRYPNMYSFLQTRFQKQLLSLRLKKHPGGGIALDALGIAESDLGARVRTIVRILGKQPISFDLSKVISRHLHSFMEFDCDCQRTVREIAKEKEQCLNEDSKQASNIGRDDNETGSL